MSSLNELAFQRGTREPTVENIGPNNSIAKHVSFGLLNETMFFCDIYLSVEGMNEHMT